MDSKTLLMAMEGTLCFTKEGDWLHNEEPVSHQGIADYFSNHLSFDTALQSYVVSAEGRSVRVEVEDTPAVVRTLSGNSDSGWIAVLNGGAEEKFLAGSLFVSPEGVWYCKVREGKIRARLLRPAIQHLLPFIEEQNGAYRLRCEGKILSIGSESGGE